MAATIEQLLTAIRDFSGRVGDPPETTCALVMARSGGFFGADDTGMEEAFERRHIRGESAIEAYEAWVRRWLTSEVGVAGRSEADLVMGIVRGIVRDIDAFIEESAEDQAHTRKKARDEREALAVKLADPTQADAVIAEMNEARHFIAEQFGMPLGPEVTRENALAGMDMVHERYVPKPSLEQMQEARQRLDAWRASTALLLNERG